MTDEKKSNLSPKTKMIIGVVIGGVVLLLIASFVIGMVAKKAGTAMLEGAIEGKTGVKTDFGEIEKGKVTFTDKKTGETVTVGSSELPKSFPKDFPVYKNATVISSASNVQQENVNGQLVIFSTKDGLDKVVPFYKKELASKGWEITSSFDSDSVQTWAVTKGTTEGTVSITSAPDQTTIQIALGEKQ